MIISIAQSDIFCPNIFPHPPALSELMMGTAGCEPCSPEHVTAVEELFTEAVLQQTEITTDKLCWSGWRWQWYLALSSFVTQLFTVGAQYGDFVLLFMITSTFPACTLVIKHHCELKLHLWHTTCLRYDSEYRGSHCVASSIPESGIYLGMCGSLFPAQCTGISLCQLLVSRQVSVSWLLAGVLGTL